MPQGCEGWAEEIAYAIEAASIAHEVDPRLLVALSYHESSLLGRSNTVSKGYFGWNRRLAFWRQCSEFDVECQADVTAMHLRELLLFCGSWDGALSAYQSGYCRTDSGVRYAARVMATGSVLDV
jgi:hypothetical protein